MRFSKILITGGAGFIGSALVRALIRDSGCHVVNVDALTYAGNLDSLEEVRGHPQHHFERANICDRSEIERIFREQRPEAIIHLAAESHVDRSIHGPRDFVDTNILGTYTLLEVAREYWNELEVDARDRFRFHHVSTDEVYGDLGPSDPPFREDTPYAPSSPYSASKAASDHMVRAWHRTFGLPVVLSNCSNNYGPYQFPEKLIPLVVLNAVEGRTLPVYGRGENIRDWLFVDDHVAALRLIFAEGRTGRTYNIGGRNEVANIDVVKAICAILDERLPDSRGPYERLIQFVTDRPGHDRRYAVDDTRLAQELGWSPQETFETGLWRTVEWYLKNPIWVERVKSGAYQQWIQSHYGDRGPTE